MMVGTRVQTTSPYARRIEVLWRLHREQVLESFPHEPGLPKNGAEYLASVNHHYVGDAYHSLSIEGYHVSPQLIEAVVNHRWNPDESPIDGVDRDALAARGYYEAFQAVKRTLARVLEGVNASDAVEQDLPEWYRLLWRPCQEAQLIPPEHTIGYRRGPVYIRGSKHVPPPREALMDAMEMLFSCLKQEPHAAVRAVLGHYLFVFIHPYPDGNGRIGRFVMNAMFASGGYPWTVVRADNRDAYIGALEEVHLKGDISRLARFLAHEMEATPLITE
jgi:Fic family protein